MARPTKYNDEDTNRITKALYELGKTDKEVAEIIGISEQTLNTWKIKHKKFLESLKEAKSIADRKVEESLYKRACGYEKELIKDNGNIEEKHYPPDTTACIFWLKNRKPKDWRDKQELAVEDDTLSKLEITVNPRAKEK